MTRAPTTDRLLQRVVSRQLLYLTEPARAMADASVLAAAYPLLRLAPRGQAHPVLVLPGLLATDSSTAVLRRWIDRLGYPVVGWDLGRNRGPTRRVVDGLPRAVERLADRYGQPVSVVGWSMGGIFARRLASRMPEQIRQVITLGSPFASDAGNGDTPGERAYRRYARRHVADRIHPDDAAGAHPPAVPSTSVYSRWDGIVDWRSCLLPAGPRSENIEVRASHLGLGHHPAVLWIVADRLARPADGWQPFRTPDQRALRLLFAAASPSADAGG
ncbi:esterase/lipase family protein [Cryptosporangium minutisporangium]|uniref:Alpha/beta hydrolase n=1 Tax=Cryptosporangium minutisporangium TaxID=113569 RepID=A0ABP6SS21_9ACTN